MDALLETPLESVSPVGEFSEAIAAGSYDVVEAVIHSANSTIFKALDSSGQGPDLNVKVFHIDGLPDESVPELLDKVLLYQSAMHDRNIVKVLARPSWTVARRSSTSTCRLHWSMCSESSRKASIWTCCWRSSLKSSMPSATHTCIAGQTEWYEDSLIWP